MQEQAEFLHLFQIRNEAIMGHPSWRIQMFGSLKAERDGRTISHFETRKTAALLACLALQNGKPLSREALAEQLWPDEEWEATRNRLRQALSVLRREMEAGETEGSVLTADRMDVCLNAQAVTTDAAEFRALIREASRLSDASDRRSRLLRAVELYTGELLPGYYEGWIVRERQWLAEEYRNTLCALSLALAEENNPEEAIHYGRLAVWADPLREDAHANLMRFYATTGRQADVLRQYRELERVLREELGVVPSPAVRALRDDLQNAEGTSHYGSVPRPSPYTPSSNSPYVSHSFESEGGAVPLASEFYIQRPTDTAFLNAIVRCDSIVLVKGARQIGKTSLLARGLQQARQEKTHVVMTDLQKLAPAHLETVEGLFRVFAEMMTDQLDLDITQEEIWNPRWGWTVNFERFLRREVLMKVSRLVWGLDEVDRLFDYPYSQTVFGLFRSWHNERSLNPDGPWGRLTLAIAYATEAHLFITDLNQSPFNVGTRLTLEDFTPSEVAELNRRYGGALRESDMERFCALVGGHPYLVRRALHLLANDGLELQTLEARADREDGPFGDHLRRLSRSLLQNTALCEAMREVLNGEVCLSMESFYRLRSAGVLVGESAPDARPRCALYSRYLENRLL
jgi:DNA-binding SARP family transcriptional activator